MQDFLAIDLETANKQCSSVCYVVGMEFAQEMDLDDDSETEAYLNS
ncbi:hypothetical protein [Hallella sp.]